MRTSEPDQHSPEDLLDELRSFRRRAGIAERDPEAVEPTEARTDPLGSADGRAEPGELPDQHDGVASDAALDRYLHMFVADHSVAPFEPRTSVTRRWRRAVGARLGPARRDGLTPSADAPLR